jgi:hypothetical protein
VTCVRPGTNEVLGQADFEFGYYPVYVYEELKNQVPAIGPLTFDAPSSVDACSAASSDDCPAYTLAPTISGSSAEPAVSSHIAAATAPLETIWVSYYATGGVFDKDSRIAHDGISGWSSDWAGVWRPQLAGGRDVRLFAVVRDNRGGVAWLEQDVTVR